MSGNVGATCRLWAASCNSRICPCIGSWQPGTDEWKCRCNLPPAGGKLHLPHFPMNGQGLNGQVLANGQVHKWGRPPKTPSNSPSEVGAIFIRFKRPAPSASSHMIEREYSTKSRNNYTKERHGIEWSNGNMGPI